MHTHRTKLKYKLLAGVALTAAALTAHATELAPYFYTWAFGSSGYAANSLAQAKAAGVDAVTLAFGTSNGSCTLQGFNFDSSTQQDVQNYIAGGGRVILSFGGASGPFLEDDCSVSQLYNIINNLISTYKIYNLDFDVEGPPVDNTSSANTRNAVIKQLQAAYPNLYVSFTVPVGSGGLPGDVQTLIQNAKNSGVKINVVNIMTMDYGGDTGGANNEGGTALDSANATFNQLKSIYPNLSTAQLWSMIGITPMIGLNDGSTTNNPTEQFTPADATTVTQFAETNGIGLLSFWALNRDQPGVVNSENDLDLYDNTGTTKFEFYNIMKPAETDNGGGGTPPVNGTFPAGTYTIVNVFSGKCVDVNAASTSPGAVVQQYTCNGTGAQSFQVIDEGSGWFKILNTNSHLAVDVIGASTADGTHIQQYTDNGTGAQRFSISVTDTSDPTAFEVVNQTSGKCLDDTDWGTGDRNPLQQWSCSGGSNQSWRFYPIGSTTPVSVR